MPWPRPFKPLALDSLTLPHSVQSSYQIPVHHQMNEVVEHAEREGHAVLGKKLALKQNGKGQSLLATHEKDALQPSPRDMKQTDRQEPCEKKNRMKHERQEQDNKYLCPAAQHRLFRL